MQALSAQRLRCEHPVRVMHLGHTSPAHKQAASLQSCIVQLLTGITVDLTQSLMQGNYLMSCRL